MSIICVLSINLHRDDVWPAPDQGWLVEGGKMVNLVVQFVVAAAATTISLTVIASRQGSADVAGKSPVV